MFRTRIELRQIGVRDGPRNAGARHLRRVFCCTSFLGTFSRVHPHGQGQGWRSTRQDLGHCGRSCAASNTSRAAYEDLIAPPPKTRAGHDARRPGTVIGVNLLTGIVRCGSTTATGPPSAFHKSEVRITPRATAEKRGAKQARTFETGRN